MYRIWLKKQGLEELAGQEKTAQGLGDVGEADKSAEDGADIAAEDAESK